MHHTYFLKRRTLSVQLLYCVFERNVLALERAAYIRSGFRPLVCAIYFVNCYPSRPAEHSCSDGTKMSTETEKALYTIELTLHEICDFPGNVPYLGLLERSLFVPESVWQETDHRFVVCRASDERTLMFRGVPLHCTMFCRWCVILYTLQFLENKNSERLRSFVYT